MGRIYIASPIDEVQLANRAQTFVDDFDGRIPTASELAALTRAHDIDLATMAFYQAVRVAKDNKDFVDAIDRQAVGQTTDKRITLLILPALFYEEHPEVGGDGAHVANVARACGIDAHVVPTVSRGGIDDDLPIVRKALQDVKDGEIWIMTLSKGATSWRCLLQQHSDDIPLERVTTWFNVGGLPNGCQLVDLMLRSRLRRIRTRAFCKVIRMNFNSFCEFGTANPRLQEPLQMPEHLRVINVVGSPLTSHVEKSMQTRFLMLKHMGPNDGMVLLPDALWLPGAVYPVLGADHFFRGTQISSLLYRLFAYVFAATENK
jgi:hypothetical protein